MKGSEFIVCFWWPGSILGYIDDPANVWGEVKKCRILADFNAKENVPESHGLRRVNYWITFRILPGRIIFWRFFMTKNMINGKTVTLML